MQNYKCGLYMAESFILPARKSEHDLKTMHYMLIVAIIRFGDYLRVY